MNTTMIFLLRLVGAVGVAAVFYAMLAGPVLLLGDGAGDAPGRPPRLASRCTRMQGMSNRTDAVPRYCHVERGWSRISGRCRLVT